MRGANTEIRQQLRNQSLEDLLTTSINTVGGRIFPDDLAVIDMDALNQIVNTWRSTHVSAYGQVLPNSGSIVEGIADGGGVSPDDNEVMDIVAASIANGGVAPIDVEIKLGDLVLMTANVPPSETVASNDLGLFPMTLSKNLALKFSVTSGTPSDFSAKVAYQYRSR